MRASVTDGQLGQLAVKSHELFRRAKEGTYENFDDVLVGLQTLIEGKEPTAPTLASEDKFAKWRNFLIGGVNSMALLRLVQADSIVSDWAKDVMKQKAFTTEVAEEEIETIILTPADFGYERQPTTTELFDPKRLAWWSKQNAHRLPSGYVVELFPSEAGPHIRDQYKVQPQGEVLWIAMERIVDSDHYPSVFTVGRHGDGGQWLDADWADPEGQWNLGGRIVFRLRKVA